MWMIFVISTLARFLYNLSLRVLGHFHVKYNEITRKRSFMCLCPLIDQCSNNNRPSFVIYVYCMLVQMTKMFVFVCIFSMELLTKRFRHLKWYLIDWITTFSLRSLPMTRLPYKAGLLHSVYTCALRFKLFIIKT
jgi:hypothetical protein